MPTVAVNMTFNKQRYVAGQQLEAKVLVDSSDPDTIVTNLSIEVKGAGKTGWVNVHTDKIFESEKTYISTRVTLASHLRLTPGRHYFPVMIAIPEDAPSSYESQYGVIRYQAKVYLESNSEQASSQEVFPFIVLARSFLSQMPANLLSAVDYKEEVDFTCCTLPFGTVSIQINLTRTAFVAGESVEAIVDMWNGTRKEMRDTTLNLVCKAQFEARSRYEHVDERKLSEDLIVSIPLGHVKGRTKHRFDTAQIAIPAEVPPTHNTGNGDKSIITIHYVLKLTATPGIELEIPIVIAAAFNDLSLV